MNQEKMFDEYLRQLATHIPGALIGEQSFQSILITAKLLPESAMLNTFGFECPLNNSDPNADFLLSFQSKKRGPEKLLQTAKHNINKSPVWIDVACLAKLWTKNAFIDDFWLEFDIQGDAPTIPSIFFRPLYNDLPELEFILAHTMISLTGTEDIGRLKDRILQLATLLPPKARIFQIGAMRSRPVKGVRLCINEISLDAILEFLEAISYPGPIEEVKQLLIFLQPLMHNVNFSIDVSDEIGPKIGFEGYMNWKLSDLERQLAQIKMLDQLYEKQDIDQAKMQALKTIDTHFDTEKLFTELPDELLFTKALMEHHLNSKVLLYLHHIKVSYTPKNHLQTKAYIAVQHTWC